MDSFGAAICIFNIQVDRYRLGADGFYLHLVLAALVAYFAMARSGTPPSNHQRFQNQFMLRPAPVFMLLKKSYGPGCLPCQLAM
jgi:hypothetical protein